MLISLNEIIDRVYSAMTERLLEQEKDDHCAPLALIFKGDQLGVVPVQQLAFAGPAWGQVLSSIIKQIHEQSPIDAYAVGQECPAIVEPTVSDMLQIMKGDKKVSEMDSAEELLVIQAGDTFQTIEKIWNVIRDAETGKIVDFTAREMPPNMPIVGGFYDLLVQRPERLN